MKCHKRGHYAKMCMSTRSSCSTTCNSSIGQRSTVHEVEEIVDHLFLGAVRDSASDCKPWTKHVEVGGLPFPVYFKLDTGADVTVFPNRLCSNIEVETTKSPVGPGNTEIPMLGGFVTKLSVNDKCHVERVYVVDQDKALLGRAACIQLGLVSCSREVDQVSDGPGFKSEFSVLFEGLGKMKQEVDIELKVDGHAFATHTPRSVPHPLLGRVTLELESMASEVIFPVTRPTDWCAPTVVAPKSNASIYIYVC